MKKLISENLTPKKNLLFYIFLVAIISLYSISPSFCARKGYEEAKISMDLNNVPLTQVLKVVTAQSALNFTVAREIREMRITARFKNTPIEEVLIAISDANGLIFERVGKTNSVIIRKRKRILPRTSTEILQLNNIQLLEFEETDEGGVAKNITNVVSDMLSEYGKINIDPRTNSIVVTDLPERIPHIKQIIRGLDVRVPQIEIEVEMVEVNSDNMTRLGLEFGGAKGELLRYGGPVRETGFPLEEGTNIGDIFRGEGELTYGTLSMQEFAVLLKALSTKGKGKFLARPRILTSNNKKAQINITANTAIGIIEEEDEETGKIKYYAERDETGIILEVTPQVNKEGYISMLVEPKVIRAAKSQFFPTHFVDPQTRSAKTTVVIKNGTTLVIGGLVADDDEKTVRKIPIIGHIPVIGWFFSGLESAKSKKELLIFITPRVVESS